MQITECLNGGVDQSLCAIPRGDVVTVGDRLAAHRFNLIDHLLGRRNVASHAINTRTEVVDHDMSAMSRQTQRVFATDTSAGSGDYCNTSFT
jgi:hypothetical protein